MIYQMEMDWIGIGQPTGGTHEHFSVLLLVSRRRKTTTPPRSLGLTEFDGRKGRLEGWEDGIARRS